MTVRASHFMALMGLGFLLDAAPARAQSHLEVGAGLDYRYVYYSFSSYAGILGPRLSTEEAFRAFGAGADAAWLFDLTPRLRVGPAASLSATFGGYDAWVSGQEVGTGGGRALHAELSAQAGYQFTPSLRGTLRLGIGTIVTTLQPGPAVDPYRYEQDEGAVALLGTIGLAYEVAFRIDVALLFQTDLGYLSAWADYRPTGYEPAARDYATHAVQVRAVVRFDVVTGGAP
jgi:hypothetical protein